MPDEVQRDDGFKADRTLNIESSQFEQTMAMGHVSDGSKLHGSLKKRRKDEFATDVVVFALNNAVGSGAVWYGEIITDIEKSTEMFHDATCKVRGVVAA